MTMPHLMNCQHSEDGWCLECVKALHGKLGSAVRLKPVAWTPSTFGDTVQASTLLGTFMVTLRPMPPDGKYYWWQHYPDTRADGEAASVEEAKATIERFVAMRIAPFLESVEG